MKHSNFSNSKGITMVSLVVTIIVLLILATIGIMAVTGDNGILSSSIRAKNEAEQSSKNIIENEENFIGDINQGYSGTEAGKNIFSIEYDNNGGEGGPQKQNAATDGDSVNITITETEPTKKDSTFLGWSENKDATSPEYEPGKSYEIAENKILYAVYVSNKGTVTINPNGGKWRDNTSTYQINGTKDQKVTLDNPIPPAGYTVTFNGNGGSNPAAQTTTKSFTSWTLVGAGSIDGSTYTFGVGNGDLTANYIDNAITLPSIEVTGFTFLGWYDSPSGGNKVGEANGKYTATKSITLYAHWKRNSYTLTIKPNGGTWNGKTDNTSITQEFNSTLTIPNPTPPNDYTITFKPQNNTNDIVLSADRVFSGWSNDGPGVLNGTTYTFKAGNGTLTANYTTNSISLPSVSTTGFTFLGWYDSASGGSKVGDIGEKYVPTKNITLYGHWKRNSYTLTVNPNGGTWNGSTSTATFTQEFNSTKTIANPTAPAGYTVTFNGNSGSEPDAKTSTKSFTSWSKSGSGTLNGTTFTFGAGNTTLTANYRNNSISLPSSTRNGYTFLGWYDAATNGSKIGNGGAAYTPTANKTLYAHWDDTTIPTMGTLTKSPTGWTKGNVTLTGKARDLGSGITAYQFSTNSGLTASSDGWTSITKTTSEITKTYTATSNDTYYFYVKDAEENVNKSSIVVNNIDRTAPNSSISAGSVNNKTITLTARGSDSQSGVATYKFYVGGKLVSTQTTKAGTATYNYSTRFGNKSAYVIVTDAVGNSKQSSSVSFWDYTIKYNDELPSFSSYVNGGTNFSGKTITLLNDLSYNATLTPIGTSSKPFAGTFEGGWHTITGITASSSTLEDVGMFGYTTGTIKNLTLANATFNGPTNVGGIAGRSTGTIQYCYANNIKITSSTNGSVKKLGGIAGNSTGTITGCFTSGGSITVTITAWEAWAGGIAGIGKNISNCSNRGTQISGYNSTGPSGIGGIVGSAENGTVNQCFNSGSVSGYGYVGGIAGANNSILTNSFNSGPVSVPGNIISTLTGFPLGGIVGWNNGNGNISICYNTGRVTNNSSTGIEVMTGGLVGYNTVGSITKCYTIGTVSAKAGNVAALIASNEYNGRATYCYALSGVHSTLINNTAEGGMGTSSNVSFKSSTDLKNSYGTLGMKAGGSQNSGYPILSWQ